MNWNRLNFTTRLAVWSVCLVLFTSSLGAAESQSLREHAPPAVKRLHLEPIGRLPDTNELRLAIGLPLRNPEELSKLLAELYDPASSHYRQYLTPEQFTERFGPTEADYAAVIAF